LETVHLESSLSLIGNPTEDRQIVARTERAAFSWLSSAGEPSWLAVGVGTFPEW